MLCRKLFNSLLIAHQSLHAVAMHVRLQGLFTPSLVSRTAHSACALASSYCAPPFEAPSAWQYPVQAASLQWFTTILDQDMYSTQQLHN